MKALVKDNKLVLLDSEAATIGPIYEERYVTPTADTSSITLTNIETKPTKIIMFLPSQQFSSVMPNSYLPSGASTVLSGSFELGSNTSAYFYFSFYASGIIYNTNTTNNSYKMKVTYNSEDKTLVFSQSRATFYALWATNYPATYGFMLLY